MYNSNNVADIIKQVAKSKQITIKKLLQDIGLGFNTMSNMKTSMPKADNLAKIADYLNCSVDYLLGRSNCCENDNLSKTENYLISNFRRLSPKGQEYILSTMDAALVLYKNEKGNLKFVANESVSAPPIVIDDEADHT